MKVAWVAHHNLSAPQGGAEMTDREMIARSPEGVEVVPVDPRRSFHPESYDRVVISRLEAMPPNKAEVFASTEPVFFSHGNVLPRTEHTRRVVEASRPFIAQSPLSLEHIKAWAPETQGIAMVPYMDLDGIQPGFKQDYALWAHRPIGHKGRDLAEAWAERTGTEIVFLSKVGRARVLEEMSRARWFVLLSKILDGCPRAIREAQLSGCELVVNDLVGVWDLPPDELRRRTLDAPRVFWEEIVGA